MTHTQGKKTVNRNCLWVSSDVRLAGKVFGTDVIKMFKELKETTCQIKESMIAMVWKIENLKKEKLF